MDWVIDDDEAYLAAGYSVAGVQGAGDQSIAPAASLGQVKQLGLDLVDLFSHLPAGWRR